MQPLWTEFVTALHQPEYLHLLWHPLPIYGLAAGLVSLVLALVFGSRPAETTALLVIVLTAAAAWPAAHYGHAAYDRVYAMTGGDAQQWLAWHQHLADRLVWVDYAAAACAAATLFGLWVFLPLHRAAVSLTLAMVLAALATGGFLAFVGGKIRHPEFRHGPPPAWAGPAADKT
jgi:hypothetical protein